MCSCLGAFYYLKNGSKTLYQIRGLAQLVEHVLSMDEVAGSIVEFSSENMVAMIYQSDFVRLKTASSVI